MGVNGIIYTLANFGQDRKKEFDSRQEIAVGVKVISRTGRPVSYFDRQNRVY